MSTLPHLIVCEHCDSVFQLRELDRDESARCSVCDAVLYRGGTLEVSQLLALIWAAAIAFAVANAFPVIHVAFRGLHSDATLWQSVQALAKGAAAPIAVPAALVVILVPLAQILLLAWVLGFAHAGQRAPAFVFSMKALGHLRPWSMVEVCMLGILVAFVKLSGYLTVVAGVGMWATAALMALLMIIASHDPHWLWHTLESRSR